MRGLLFGNCYNVAEGMNHIFVFVSHRVISVAECVRIDIGYNI
jgi:hypothetical protein